MTKAIYNLEKLVCVKIHDKEKCPYLTYKPFKKGLWKDRPAGFYPALYSLGGDCMYTPKELENGAYYGVKLLIVDTIAYYRPHVELIFEADEKTDKVFDTYEEALDWGNKMANGFKAKLELY